ncbi:Thermonuclease precursor [Rubripirellula lacrimiformis]|uniref:Thermonuclease n=1 Tax=Rubripirellula lacrimiformis TaxID=1930273 RepID=A0A517NC58_9BACT|nr:Thermonuclease precursor [Rubripirellula lacrimiformis]
MRLLLALGLLISATAGAADLPPLVFKASSPTIEPARRTWTDSSGTRAIVASLIRAEKGKLLLERVDGNRFITNPDHLSVADRAFAVHATAPRVNQSANIAIGFVTSIMDGDTIQLRTIAEENITIRLDGIDAPEQGQDFGNVAKDFLGSRIHEKVVRVELRERDRYNRNLADVYLGDTWLNLELARNGLAWHYKKYNEDQRFADAESESKAARRGLWSRNDLVPPWDFRNGVTAAPKRPAMANIEQAIPAPSIRTTDTTVYITDTGTKYHRQSCRYCRKSSSPIPLSRAISAYDACKVCKPPSK